MGSEACVWRVTLPTQTHTFPTHTHTPKLTPSHTQVHITFVPSTHTHAHVSLPWNMRSRVHTTLWDSQAHTHLLTHAHVCTLTLAHAFICPLLHTHIHKHIHTSNQMRGLFPVPEGNGHQCLGPRAWGQSRSWLGA